MKKRYRMLAAILLMGILISSCSSFGNRENMANSPAGQALSEESVQAAPQPWRPGDNEINSFGITGMGGNEFRAVWVATVLNLDFPSQTNLSAESLKDEIDRMVARVDELGLNAIIFQVRPTGDAFHESDIFPWSQWLSGEQGVGIENFDPLAYWIQASHAKGIELHAWINPYRIIHTVSNSSDPATLAPNHPVRLRPELAVAWTDTNGREGLFLDPGLPEARQLILDGIEEIIRNYNIDGIHFDDYFYPGTNFDDTASFYRYGNDMDLHDWRRENVNTLIREIQTTIRGLNAELGRGVRWGISPTAIWKNQSSDPLGVPTTRGMESYHALYADTRLWVMEEWVDYINPQIYWYIGFEIADFEAVFNWWTELCEGRNVALYIGHAAWREELDEQSPNWRGEILRQLAMVEQSSIANGNVFFRMEHLFGTVGNTIRDFYRELDVQPQARRPVMILDTLSIGTPNRDVTIAASPTAQVGHNITGTSDPNIALYINGTEVTNRTIEGFFFIHVSLEPGENVFTLTQDGQRSVSRTITRNSPSAPSTDSSPPPEITQIETPRYAVVTSDEAWAFPRNTSSGGSDWMLSRGQLDRVVAEASNGFVRLSSGIWVRRENVSITDEDAFTSDVLSNGEYRVGTEYDMIVWETNVFSAVNTSFDGQILTVSFGMHSQPPPLSLPEDLSDTMIESAEHGLSGETPYYAFVINPDSRFEGQFVTYEDGELRLHLKRRKTLQDSDRPLTGISIVLDAGHGGSEYGAIGPLGNEAPEKDIVLVNARKLAQRLTAQGATVFLTRNEDISVPLQDRVDLSRRVRPDLFISLHINSVDATTNAENIRGFTVWYRNAGSREFAQTVLDIMYDINPETTRHRNINQANFFVCRPQWSPHVILEASFIVNIDDFVWLIDPNEQNRMADATVEAIMEYFQ